MSGQNLMFSTRGESCIEPGAPAVPEECVGDGNGGTGAVVVEHVLDRAVVAIGQRALLDPVAIQTMGLLNGGTHFRMVHPTVAEHPMSGFDALI